MSMEAFEAMFEIAAATASATFDRKTEQARQKQIDDDLRGDFDEKLAQIAQMDQAQSAIVRHKEPANQISLPEDMSYAEAKKGIESQIEADEVDKEFVYPMVANFFDGLVALEGALQAMYGMTGKGMTRWSFFGGETKPTSVNIQVGLKVNPRDPAGPMIPDEREVPASEFYFEPLKATFSMWQWSNGEVDNLFCFQVVTKTKYKHRAQATKVLVENWLATRSIYRGQILEFDPSKKDGSPLRQVDRQVDNSIVYSIEASRALQNEVLGKISRAKQLRAAGIDPKFRVLMYGPLGTGKTAGVVATAVAARAQGMTVIEYRPTTSPSVSELQKVWRLAKMYGPSVVLVEDFDRFFPQTGISRTDRGIITNLLDGVDKSDNVSMLTTTNFLDHIDPSVVRPPRLTGLVEIKHLDRAGIEELLHRTLGDQLAPEIDFDQIWEEVKDFSPAFIRKTYVSAKAYAIQNDDEGLITTEALVDAARASHNHHAVYDRLENKRQEPAVDHLRMGLEEVVKEAVVAEVAGQVARVMQSSYRTSYGDRLAETAGE